MGEDVSKRDRIPKAGPEFVVDDFERADAHENGVSRKQNERLGSSANVMMETSSLGESTWNVPRTGMKPNSADKKNSMNP